MSRPLRLEFPGAFYHVMNRGLARQTIFQDDEDRKQFLKLLEEVHARWNLQVHAYCMGHLRFLENLLTGAFRMEQQ